MGRISHVLTAPAKAAHPPIPVMVAKMQSQNRWMEWAPASYANVACVRILSFRTLISIFRTSMQGEVAYPHGYSPKQYAWSWTPWIYKKTDGYAGGVHAHIPKCALFPTSASQSGDFPGWSLTIRLLSVDESFIRAANWGAQQEYAYCCHHQQWERQAFTGRRMTGFDQRLFRKPRLSLLRQWQISAAELLLLCRTWP